MPAGLTNGAQPPAAAAPPARRVATLVWIVGAIELLVFGYLALSAAFIASRPVEWLRQQLPQASEADVITLHATLWPRALLMAAMGCLPGLVYVISGFGVRRGGSLATGIALLLCVTQLIVFGVVFVSTLTTAVTQRDPSQITLGVLGLGTLLALLGFTAYTLRLAWRGDIEEATG
jgi:hypothetical protein